MRARVRVREDVSRVMMCVWGGDGRDYSVFSIF